MTDRPILFSGPMVRALLDGSKTQTRRVVKQQPPQNTVAIGRWQDPGPRPAWWAFLRDGPVDHDHPFGGAEIHGEFWLSPYGDAGDRLWVRETFYAFGRWETRYSAKKGRDEWHFIDMTAECGNWYFYDATSQPDAEKFRRSSITPMWWKRPAIFMPRWASRITLEITGVRVERLWDISDADAHAEGCEGTKLSYAKLWESINGPGSWDANPWVWVVEFRRQA